MAAVTQNGKSIFYASEEFHDDEQVFFKAAESFKDIFYLAVGLKGISNRVKYDREFALRIIKKFGEFYFNLNRKFQLDREIVMEALKTSPETVLLDAPCRFTVSDKAIAIRIVKLNGLLLKEMCSKHRNDREIVSFAIQQNRQIYFKYASEELQNDFEILQLLKDLD